MSVFTIEKAKSTTIFSAEITFDNNRPFFDLFYASKKECKTFDDAFKSGITESLKYSKTKQEHLAYAMNKAMDTLPEGVTPNSLGLHDSENRGLVNDMFDQIINS